MEIFDGDAASMETELLGQLGRVLLGVWILGGISSESSAACPPMTKAALDLYLADHGPQEVRFFASWCIECAKHIKEAPAKGVLMIATFDERPLAEKVYEKLEGKAPCFTDDGIAAALGVKSVPAVRRLEPVPQRRP